MKLNQNWNVRNKLTATALGASAEQNWWSRSTQEKFWSGSPWRAFAGMFRR